MLHSVLRPFVTVLTPKHVALAFAAAAVVLTGGVGDTAKTATAPKLSGTYAMMFTTFVSRTFQSRRLKARFQSPTT